MSTKNTLVVVTCLEDKWKFEMLCRSMYAFLEPCNVIVIYNEMHKKMGEFFQWFDPIQAKFLKKFNVQAHSAAEFYPSKYLEKPYTDPVHASGGWVKQQILKILVSSHVTTPEYVVFDSKNFFTRHCSLEDIEKTTHHGSWTLKGVTEWTKICCERLDLIYPGYHLKLRANTTPYWVKTKVAKRLIQYIGSVDDFVCWFSENAMAKGVSPAEFILYDLMETKLGQREEGTVLGNNATIWMHHIHGQKKSVNEIGEYIKNNPACVAGFHGGVNNLLSLGDIKTILDICKISFILPQYSSSPF